MTKKRIAKLLALLLLVTCLFGRGGLVAQAASGSIRFNDPTVTSGETVSVTMTLSCSAGIGVFYGSLSYDTSLLEYVSSSSSDVSGGGGGINIAWVADNATTTSVSFTFKFKALAAGTAKVCVNGGYDFATFEPISAIEASPGSSTVTIQAPYNASTEARLSKLQVGPGTLSPAFSPDVYSYTTKVASDVTRLVITAETMDEKASYKVRWNSLDSGENTTYITVTAESGKKVEYVIKTTREKPAETDPAETKPAETTAPEETSAAETTAPEVPGLAVNVDGTMMQIAGSLEGVTLPEGFEEQTITYEGNDAPAARGIAKGLTLLWLTDANGENGAFYVYDEAAGSFTKFVNVTVGQKIYTILKADEALEIPAGFAETTIAIGGDVVPAWIAERDMTTNFVLVYAMNWNGERSLYRYDAVEETMQRYIRETLEEEEQEPAADPELENKVAELEKRLAKMKETYESELQKKSRTTWILVGLCVLCVIALLIMFLSRKGASEQEEAVPEPKKVQEAPRKKRPADGAGKGPAEGAKKRPADGSGKRPADGAAKKRPPEGAKKKRPVDAGETPEQPRKRRPRPIAEETMIREAAVTRQPIQQAKPQQSAAPVQPAEPVKAATVETPAEPMRQPVPQPTEKPSTDTVTLSATAALLKEIEEMEAKIKNQRPAAPVVEDDDDFEVIDLED